LAQRVNTYLPGDQFAPRISANGQNYFVAWASNGQDGYGSGVYGRYLGADGTPAGTGEFLVNTTVIKDQIQPAVAADKSGRYQAVWSSFVGGINSFDLYAQTYAPPGYTTPEPLSKPVYAPPAFDPYLVGPPVAVDPTEVPAPSATADAPAQLDSPQPLVAAGVLPNGFALAQGYYTGLFSDTNGVSPESSGFFSGTVTPGGAYSYGLVLGNHGFHGSGRFNPTNGLATNIFNWGTTRAGTRYSLLSVWLQLDMSGGDQIRGTVALDTNWFSDLQADKQVFNRLTNAASVYAANYTEVIAANPNAASAPAGYGFGTVKVDLSGNVLWNGVLADGTRVSQSSTLNKQGYWPLYASLYGGSGLIIGWVQFTNQPGSDFFATNVWIKPPQATVKYYTNAFTNEFPIIGSVYTPPAPGSALLGITNGQVILYGGNLSAPLAPLTNTFLLSAQNQPIRPAGSKLSLSLNLSSGLFTGSARDTATGWNLAFQGALIESLGNGFGFFLGTNQSGEVILGPAP
jgi:hypothetical protein